MDFYKQEYVIRQRDIVVIFKERYSLGLSFLENTIPTMRRNLADIFMNENEYISE